MFTPTTMKAAWIILAASAAGARMAAEYFPPGSLSPHSPESAAHYSVRFGGVLEALQEKPLPRGEAAGATYRYTFMPSFSASIMVRVERAPSGETRLIRKELTPLGEKVTALAGTQTRRLTDSEWRSIEVLAQGASFWTLPPDTFEMGLDGAQLLLEGAGPRGYHVVHRWSPDDGSFLRLCARLRELAEPERSPVVVVDPRSRTPVSLTGAATDASTGVPLDGITVLIDGGGVSEARATDAQGHFAIPGLQVGIYQLRFQRFVGEHASSTLGWYTFPDDGVFVQLRPNEGACLRASLGPPPRADAEQPPRPPAIRDCRVSGDAPSLPVQDHAPARRP
jgi:hypothetical protein